MFLINFYFKKLSWKKLGYLTGVRLCNFLYNLIKITNSSTIAEEHREEHTQI